MLAIEKKVS